MKLLRLSSAVLAAALLLPVVASAQVTVQYDNVVNTGGDQVGGAFTGPYSMHQTLPVPSASFNVYCIDYDHMMQTTWPARYITFAQATNIGTDNTAAVRQLGTGVTLANLRTAAYLSTQFASAPLNTWDDIHGAIWSMFSSGVSLTPEMSLALSTAHGLADGNATLDANYRLALDERAYNSNIDPSLLSQAFITADGNTTIRVITPEPGTYALMGAGLLAVGLVRRRRRSV